MGRITLAVDGIALDSVSWDVMDGGDIAPTMEKYNPGGMAPEVALGGLRKRTDITLHRVWSDFLIASYIALDNASGIAGARVAYTPMRADRRTPAGSPVVYTGVLGQVMRPNYDSKSAAPAMLQVTVSVNEAIS